MQFKKLAMALTLLVGVFVGSFARQPQHAHAQDAEPQVQEGVAGVMAAFDSHALVAIGEYHGLQQLGDFYEAIVRHPDFAANVGNLVMEFGNAHYQDTIDRYVNGEELPQEELEKVWTPTIGAGTNPIAQMYADLYAAVREVNQALPEDQRIRVWLGDPPMDFSQPAPTDANGQPALVDRDAFYAQVVANLLRQNEKALLIVGEMHVKGGMPMLGMNGNPGDAVMVAPGANPPAGNPPSDGTIVVAPGGNLPPGAPPMMGGSLAMPSAKMLITLLEEQAPGQTYVIAVHVGNPQINPCVADLESRLAEVQAPALLSIEGTWVETLLNRPDCQPAGPAGPVEIAPPDQHWADGYLYLGAVETLMMSPTAADAAPLTYLEAAAMTPNIFVMPSNNGQ